MRSVAIVCVCLILAGAPVLAQAPGGQIGVYTDAVGGGDCSLVEQLYAINTVWVVHRTGPAAQGARFKVDLSWSATVIQATYPVIYLVNPDIFGGDTFGYGGCKTTPQWIARIDFLPTVATPPCTAEIHVVPDPAAASGSIEVFDCDGNTVLADPDTQWIVVNRDLTCNCHVDPVNADESTWSRIKAMYR